MVEEFEKIQGWGLGIVAPTGEHDSGLDVGQASQEGDYLVKCVGWFWRGTNWEGSDQTLAHLQVQCTVCKARLSHQPVA